MNSAIYTGSVYHVRGGPHAHTFRMKGSWLYLDLDELPEVFRGRWFWSARRLNLAWFRRRDYMGPADIPLREAVLNRVERELGRRPDGDVRVLTQVRQLGYVFNPVSFYYCFDVDGRLSAIAAEITNTPWGERHTYVLDAQAESGALRFRFDKAFHVSPFHPMEQVYEWRFEEPGEALVVNMRNEEAGEVVFQAGMRLERQPMTAGNLARLLLRRPFQTFLVHAAIYVHAALLWRKRAQFHPHPAKRAALHDAPPIR